MFLGKDLADLAPFFVLALGSEKEYKEMYDWGKQRSNACKSQYIPNKWEFLFFNTDGKEMEDLYLKNPGVAAIRTAMENAVKKFGKKGTPQTEFNKMKSRYRVAVVYFEIGCYKEAKKELESLIADMKEDNVIKDDVKARLDQIGKFADAAIAKSKGRIEKSDFEEGCVCIYEAEMYLKGLPDQKKVKDAITALETEQNKNPKFAKAKKTAQNSCKALKMYQDAQLDFLKGKTDAAKKAMMKMAQTFTDTRYSILRPEPIEVSLPKPAPPAPKAPEKPPEKPPEPKPADPKPAQPDPKPAGGDKNKP
jgi:tetratricopeptide (TPR) repeat protein